MIFVTQLCYNFAMQWIDTLEKRYGKYAIEHLSSYLIIGQIVTSIGAAIYRPIADIFYLQGNLIYRGEVWRIVTFLFTPVLDNLLFAAFAWYMLYLCGTMLENRWGAFRYMLYLSISVLGSIITALLFPQQGISNGYLYASQFAAFAYLYPEVIFTLFFILPVKAKWLGILAWIGIAITVLFGTLSGKVLALFSLSNFFLFFGPDILQIFRGQRLSIKLKQREIPGVRNICAVCGKYEMDHRDLDFRYCPDCDPPTCYCPEHIDLHQHRHA